MELSKIILYRMTHIENIPHVLQNGITHSKSANANQNFVTIGDVSLIDTRKTRKVIVDNGGDDLNFTITLGDFIPFYFGVKMPMLYVMQNGGNFVKKATRPEDIIYMACSIRKIVDSKFTYYFSDGHATDHLTTFFDKSKITSLPNLIDWNAVKMQYWAGQENLDNKRKKQAEFLVADDIPSDCIIGFGCYNDKTKTALKKMGINEDILKVIPNAYF